MATGTIKKRIFILLIFWLMVFSSEAGDTLRVEVWDTATPVEYRSPSFEEIESLRQDPRYDYDRGSDKQDLITRLLMWFFQHLYRGISEVTGIKYVLLVAGFVVLFLLMLRLMNMPFMGVFSFFGSAKPTEFNLVHEVNELQGEELDKMFGLYRENKAYREAVRILYLMFLQKLFVKGIIKLRYYKTNREYASEIKDESLQHLFRRLSRMYEFVWYGHFEPDDTYFNEIETAFRRSISSFGQNPEDNGRKE